MDPQPNQASPSASTSPNQGVEQRLGSVLVQNGLLTTEQVRSAEHYAQEHRCDLRQAILELSLLTPERLNELAFEHLSALAGGGQSGSMPPLRPDRAQLQRDIRQELMELAATTDIPELSEHIIARAFDSRATDIHIDPEETAYRIRYRIDGMLHEVLEMPSPRGVSLLSRIKVMSNLRMVERRHPQDGGMLFDHGGQPRNLRIATLPLATGERMVIRVHEALNETLGFEQLGLQAEQIEKLHQLIQRPYGVLLVAGPVGAGKTTTLYSCLRWVNQPTRNVITIEDPIEYRLKGVNQAQVDPHSGLSFAEGVQASLRQDPDVLMIGEIRDDETARVGIRAALTGVLIFSTIHASDAAGVVSTLLNYGVPGYVLSGALHGVVSQRLVRKICPYCRERFEPDAASLRALKLDPEQNHDIALYRGRGCTACFQTGYLGRTGVFEIMEIHELLRDLILQQTTKEVLHQVAMDEGMKSFQQCAIDKVLEGVTTVEELHRISI